MHVTKLVVHGAAAVLAHASALIGPLLAPASLAGSWTGKQIADRIPASGFVIVVEVALVISGIALTDRRRLVTRAPSDP